MNGLKRTAAKAPAPTVLYYQQCQSCQPLLQGDCLQGTRVLLYYCPTVYCCWVREYKTFEICYNCYLCECLASYGVPYNATFQRPIPGGESTADTVSNCSLSDQGPPFSSRRSINIHILILIVLDRTEENGLLVENSILSFPSP